MEIQAKKISFVLKILILLLISIMIFFYISNLQASFTQPSSGVNINDITVETINYLWNLQYPQNLVILLFFSFVILFLITHAIIIYQEGVDEHHG